MPDELFVRLENLLGEAKANEIWDSFLYRIKCQTEMLEEANSGWQMACAEKDARIAQLEARLRSFLPDYP